MQKYIIVFSTLLSVVLLSGCIGGGLSGSTTYGMKERAKSGQTAVVDYWLTVDGELIQTTDGSEAFRFVVDSGGVLRGFNDAVKDMVVGETKEITIPGKDAYPPGHISGLGGKDLNFEIKLLAIE